ncbi:MAG: aminotransferase class I/II-fold pyridoxal phosphate-dependent enzyme [Lentisphaerae bacterium]|nr:aminotransferase class I/II-fold pyridoxal phosphate-dependent enzyme [Lentisphaerota bacterium]MCP4103113.1 aminotransferase class I/II-fold pyridoxal phosphate-dependent enzyme [Lentisphaerota bacterium]
MSNPKRYHHETLAIHAGQSPDSATLSRGVPVYRTSSYVFRDTKHGADLFALKEPGNIYSRLMNPTNDVLEQRIAELEGGAAALAFSSGTSAIFFAVTNILQAGDEIIAANNLYGGTYTQFDTILPQFGMKARFVPVNDLEAAEAQVNEKTKAIYIETIGNPVLDCADIEKYSELAKRYNLPLIVDSTFSPPTLLRPIEHGADIVVHSLTKWLGGHGAAIGGIVVDSGKFDWTDSKFSLFNEPDEGYHGLRFAHDLGEMNHLAFIIRLRIVGLRNVGPTLSPDSAWIFIQGVETLPLRIRKHSENALAVARHLEKHPKVAWVRYPGLESDPSYPVASRYLKEGFGGMVVFGVNGGSAAAEKVINNIDLFSHLANVGDARSLILHPASTSHAQLSEEQQRASGLTPELIRLSIGLEYVDDIIEALDDALELI